jgi:hypothetical protein
MVIIEFGPGQRAIRDSGVWRVEGDVAAAFVADGADAVETTGGYDPDQGYTAAKALIASVGGGRIARAQRTSVTSSARAATLRVSLAVRGAGDEGRRQSPT